MSIRVQLHGTMTVTDADGADLTPAGSRRVLGLIALLATAPNLRCRRTDLQEHMKRKSRT